MKKTLLYTVAVIGLIGLAAPAMAETVTTHTYEQTKQLPDVNQIRFSDFDVNGDGMYSMKEVGDKLFDVFDTNHDKLIDNIEWDNRSVHTIMPMEKETFKYVDHNDDGLADEISYTYDTFYQASGLIKFDENQDGLSPAEFIGVGFEELDDTENKMIDREEWHKAYMDTLAEHADNKNYNH